VMVLTTVFYTCLLKYVWDKPMWQVLPFLVVFFFFDGTFWAANLEKIPNGGWIPVTFGICFGALMTCWYLGEKSLKEFYTKNFKKFNVSELQSWLKLHRSKENTNTLDPTDDIVERVPGTGVFLTPISSTVPSSFFNMVKKIHCAPQTIVFLTVESTRDAFVVDDRLSINTLGDNLYAITAKHGYAEGKIYLEKLLEDADEKGIPNLRNVTFYVNRDQVSLAHGCYLLKLPLIVYCTCKKMFSGIPQNIHVPFQDVIEIAVRVILGPNPQGKSIKSSVSNGEEMELP